MIEEYLLRERDAGRISFHMPGHKGSRIFAQTGHAEFFMNAMDMDITEIPGADNMHDPRGIIFEMMKSYANLYGADDTFLLINGSSAGIIAAILATFVGRKPEDRRLLMTRNCHKSVYSALSLGGIEPVYIMKQPTAEDVRKALQADAGIAAFILPYPNYYGSCPDLKEIARVVHEEGRILIADQAHGAHLCFFHRFGRGEGMPVSAEEAGADIAINSIHKTLASMTQTAVLNVTGKRVDRNELKRKLSALQSTSPSYVMMASLDINRQIIEEQGSELFSAWRKGVDYVYESIRAERGIYISDLPVQDRTKLNIAIEGLSGKQLADELYRRGLVMEMYSGSLVTAMSGIGNSEFDYHMLVEALIDIRNEEVSNRRDFQFRDEAENDLSSVGTHSETAEMNGKSLSAIDDIQEETPPNPGERVSEVEVFGRESKWVNMAAAKGKIAAADVIPYPPGIPWITAFERVDEDIIVRLEQLEKEGRQINGLHQGKILIYV